MLATPAATPDIEATVQARMAATAVAMPTPTPSPAPTPDIEATVQARMTATAVAMPTPTPSPTPTLTPTPTPTPTPSPTPTPTPSAAERFRSMIERVRPSVVRISRGDGMGSGFIFETLRDGSAFIATNEHVVAGASTVDVTVNDEHIYKGEVRGLDAVRDVAVVTICCSAHFEALDFATASVGEEIAIMGYALGLPGPATVTRGIVSAVRFLEHYQSDVVQTDAAQNPGNSGGPWLNMDGGVVGMATFGPDFTPGGRPVEGVSFSIAAETVERLVHTLKTQLPPITVTIRAWAFFVVGRLRIRRVQVPLHREADRRLWYR